MISTFSFKALPHILFGPGVRSEIPKSAACYGQQTLLITGGKSFIHSPHFTELKKQLKRKTLAYTLEAVCTEPSPAIVDEIVTKYRKARPDSVVAIGGGSVLDAGKAVSAMLQEAGAVADFLEGVGSRQPSGKKIPFIAVPTTSGTGSETTSNAVLSVIGPGGFKKSLRHDNFIPDIAIVDPELTLSCPPKITGTCGMDCFTQLVEAYLSSNSSPLTDTFALQGIEAIKRSLLSAYRWGDNIEARSDLSYAAMLSGIVLANAGLGTVHGFASAVGGIISAAHGTVCGTLMEPCNRLTLERLRENDPKNSALKKYAVLGRIFSDAKQQTDAWYQDHFVHSLSELTEKLHIPDLKGYAMGKKEMKIIITATGNKYNPIQLDREDLENILQSRC